MLKRVKLIYYKRGSATEESLERDRNGIDLNKWAVGNHEDRGERLNY